jgi:hypothetical protein
MTTPRRRGLTDEAAESAIYQSCRLLRLPTIRDHYGELIDAAGREQLSYRGSGPRQSRD